MTTQFKKIWTHPIWLGVISLFGLLSALLGTGLWYLLSWIALAIPIVIIIWKVYWPKPVAKKR